jgi:hypothetical protein
VAVGKGFHIADAFVEIYADKDRLKADLATLGSDVGPSAEKGGRDVGKRLGKGLGDGADGKTVGKKVVKDTVDGGSPDADKGGRDMGDKLSRGMQLAIVRNSPLIAAAVAGGLLVGTPVMLGAASTLFMGIGILAAAQSQRVKQAWSGVFSDVKAGAEQDSGAISGALIRSAAQIGGAFTALRPQMRDTFTTVAPEVDNLTSSLVRAGRDGLGGMMTAVQRSQPAMSGFDRLIEQTGAGVGDFFRIISTKSGAAGDAFIALGSIIRSLLVILATFMSSGATLGQVILPVLASVLNVLAKALQLIAPILPVVVAGLTALKVAQSISGWMKAGADDVGRFQGAVQKAAGAVPGLAGALPLIGGALALLVAGYAQASAQEEKWARALLDGGKAAQDASAQIRQASQFYQEFGTGIPGVISNLFGLGGALNIAKNAEDETAKKAKALYDAMSPLEQKQQDVTKATNDLQLKIQEYGTNSLQAKEASQALKDKQDALTRAQEQLEQATHGVTQAMIDQANQALAMADSSFALQEAQYRTKDAQDALNKAIHDHGPASDEASRATLQLSEALSAQAAAAGKAAADSSGLTDKMELQKVQQAATLSSLLALRDQYGANFPAALQATIDRMQAAGVKLDWLSGITASPHAVLVDNPLQVGIQNSLGWLYRLSGQTAMPSASMNTSPFYNLAQGVQIQMGALNNLKSYPGIFAFADTWQAENALNWAARNRYATIYTTVNTGPNRMVATGGQVGYAGGGSPGLGGGKLFGPGGPTDDMIRAVTTTGKDIRLSPLEWVVQASSAVKYGDAKMKAINDGTASVSIDSSPGLRRAEGGPAGSGGSSIVDPESHGACHRHDGSHRSGELSQDRHKHPRRDPDAGA